MGYVIRYTGYPMHWASKMQTEITLSTTKAEYRALSQSMRQVLPIMWITLKKKSRKGLSASIMQNQGSDSRHIHQTLRRMSLKEFEGKTDGMVTMITLYIYDEMRECEDILHIHQIRAKQ
jgi:hypothetical protein